MKLKEWMDRWLDNCVKPTSKVRTYERYLGLSIHITERIGEYEMNELMPIRLQAFVSELLETGNKRTKGGLSAFLQQFINSHKKWFNIRNIHNCHIRNCFRKGSISF